ncbi:hypothetical protein PKOR_17400 [Pontibacter korlensis]|uniref:Uncharacterized protein n=1 Tax=Pontibacter korlensis TaxID=400092 RepID=A0A0E3UXU5_9BACT|nr:hypothetical protein PKOR_17400 [Pontibacter korlensis]
MRRGTLYKFPSEKKAAAGAVAFFMPLFSTKSAYGKTRGKKKDSNVLDIGKTMSYVYVILHNV